MTSFIDQKSWRAALGHPDWYLRLADEWQRVIKLADEAQNNDPAQAKQIKGEAYGAVESALAEGLIPLATEGPNFDRERRPVDIAVIHHSKNPPGMTLERLNAMHLLRLYGGYYAGSRAAESGLRGQPIWSNHFRHGRQVFYGYHWFVRQDGQVERLLEDDQIGWQSGAWHVNTRSIGICIDDNLSDKSPEAPAIKAIAGLINQHNGAIPKSSIIGHNEVRQATACPGSQFLSDWKQALLEQCFGD